jgi:3-hydroxybutyryl-CoA dehydrogenase
MKEIGIIGAGTMGHGIAQCFAVNGWSVRLYDTRPEMVPSALDRIRNNLSVFVEAGIIKADLAAETPAHLILCDTLAQAVRGTEMIIETISEELDLKRRLFVELEDLVGPGTILCTNTSAISITAISQDLNHPERVVGTHFWNPPHVLPCVEVIKGQYTSNEVFEKVVTILTAIGKEPIRVLKDVPGFIGNRMQHALQREAMAIVDQGIAAPEEVDRVVKFGFGLRLALMGPLERADLGGLDITYRVQKYLLPYLCKQTEPSPLLTQKVTDGHLGAKTGQGYYTWPPEKTAETIKNRDRLLLELIKLIRRIQHGSKA